MSVDDDRSALLSEETKASAAHLPLPSSTSSTSRHLSLIQTQLRATSPLLRAFVAGLAVLGLWLCHSGHGTILGLFSDRHSAARRLWDSTHYSNHLNLPVHVTSSVHDHLRGHGVPAFDANDVDGGVVVAQLPHHGANDDFSWVGFDVTRYAHHDVVIAASGGRIEVWWSVDPAGDAIEVAVATAHSNLTFLALGISDSGGMRGADIFVVRRETGVEDGDGRDVLVVEDRWTEGFFMPVVDKSQDLDVVDSWWRADAGMGFAFRRSVIAGCPAQDLDFRLKGGQWFLASFGASRSSSGFGYHGPLNRGMAQINLSPKPNAPPSSGDDERPFAVDVIAARTEIPNSQTSYCYSAHRLDPSEPLHVITESPILNSPLLHHIVAYSCPPDVMPLAPGEVRCNTFIRGDPYFQNPCMNFYVIWAKGRKAVDHPPHYGKSFGTLPGGPAVIVLEMHYDNPTRLAGLVDPGSGLRLSVTRHLRQHSLGVLTLGAFPELIRIPGNRSRVSITDVCPRECLSLHIPADRNGITVTSAFFHMHRRGVAASTVIVRDGREVDDVTARYFDFGYQNSVGSEFTITGAEDLVSTFEWDTTDVGDDDVVFGGEGSDDEMAFNFMEYFPQVDLYFCGQYPIGAGEAACFGFGDRRLPRFVDCHPGTPEFARREKGPGFCRG